MPRKKLTKKEIIKFIKLAKKFYKESDKSYGLCHAFINIDNFPTDESDYVNRYISGFGINNAKRLARKYGFLMPTGESNWYWWSRRTEEGINARISFLNALIKELENED